ncbi:MAG: LysM domain-containing protein [Flavobacteriaceae bacterium]|nr:LysM domain-containing protein [Flavobacteriaceae bacterium]
MKNFVIIYLLSSIFIYAQVDSVSFIDHKIKKRETLFSLSKKYNVSIDEIKSYNPILINLGLKRKMIIKIPIFHKKKNNEDNLINDLISFYEVPQKETKWRIAYKYGITIDSLEKLNPILKKNSLKAGQKIKVPKLFSQNIIEENYNYYKVKPREGIYSIERKTGISEEKLIELNPILKTQGLKEGMILKIRLLSYKKFNNENNFLTERVSLKDSIIPGVKLKLAVMLPFKLNDLEIDSLIKTKMILSKRNLHSISLDFYSGVIMASKKANSYGIETDIEFIDTRNSISHLNKIISLKKNQFYDVVIGPLIPSNFNYVSKSESFKNTTMVAPLSSKPVNFGPNVFQSVTNEKILRLQMIKYLEKIIDTTQNVVIISDSLNRKIEQELKGRFPYSQIIRPEKGGYMSTELVDSLLMDSLPNKVIFESQNLSLIANVTSLLNSQISNERDIELFTTYRANVYDNINISRKHLGNINFSYTNGSIIREDDETKKFEEEYLNEFYKLPNKEVRRAFDVTLDVLLRLAYLNRIIDIDVGETEYLENRFDYIQDINGGYINRSFYLLKHVDYTVEEINKL